MSSKGIPFIFSLEGVNLNDYWGAGTPEDCMPSHHARLFISEDEIYVDVYFKLETRLSDRFMSWFRQDCSMGVAHYMRASISEITGLTRGINFDNSKCIGFAIGGGPNESGFYAIKIKLDQVNLRQEIISETTTYGNFYLNNAGMLLASKFFGPFLNTEEMAYEFGCYARINDFEYNGLKYQFKLGSYTEANSREDRSVTIHKQPYIHVESDDKSIDPQKMFQAVSSICAACSLYLMSDIDYTVGKVYNHLGAHQTFKVSRNGFIGKGIGLWELGYEYPIETFLESDWHKAVSGEPFKFERIITKYLLATRTAGSTKFLLLFTVLEILKGTEGKAETEFQLIVKKRQAKRNCNDALKLILENYSECERREFKDKWNSTIIPMMRIKTMKSQHHSLFEKHGLKESDFKYPWSDINKLRTRVIHGGLTNEDNVNIDNYNAFLVKLAGVLILASIGISDWKLYR